MSTISRNATSCPAPSKSGADSPRDERIARNPPLSERERIEEQLQPLLTKRAGSEHERLLGLRRRLVDVRAHSASVASDRKLRCFVAYAGVADLSEAMPKARYDAELKKRYDAWEAELDPKARPDSADRGGSNDDAPTDKTPAHPSVDAEPRPTRTTSRENDGNYWQPLLPKPPNENQPGLRRRFAAISPRGPSRSSDRQLYCCTEFIGVADPPETMPDPSVENLTEILTLDERAKRSDLQVGLDLFLDHPEWPQDEAASEALKKQVVNLVGCHSHFSRRSSLTYSVAYGDIEIWKKLEGLPKDEQVRAVNAPDGYGETPLLICIVNMRDLYRDARRAGKAADERISGRLAKQADRLMAMGAAAAMPAPALLMRGTGPLLAPDDAPPGFATVLFKNFQKEVEHCLVDPLEPKNVKTLTSACRSLAACFGPQTSDAGPTQLNEDTAYFLAQATKLFEHVMTVQVKSGTLRASELFEIVELCSHAKLSPAFRACLEQACKAAIAASTVQSVTAYLSSQRSKELPASVYNLLVRRLCRMTKAFSAHLSQDFLRPSKNHFVRECLAWRAVFEICENPDERIAEKTKLLLSRTTRTYEDWHEKRLWTVEDMLWNFDFSNLPALRRLFESSLDTVNARRSGKLRFSFIPLRIAHNLRMDTLEQLTRDLDPRRKTAFSICLARLFLSEISPSLNVAELIKSVRVARHALDALSHDDRDGVVAAMKDHYLRLQQSLPGVLAGFKAGQPELYAAYETIVAPPQN